jgi:hypothetical protein
VWLTQALLNELFQATRQNVSAHLLSISDERELDPGASIKSYLIVRSEGSRQVSRSILHYNPEASLAVGCRVRSPRGTQFRQWAAARLAKFLVGSFTLDDRAAHEPARSRYSLRRVRACAGLSWQWLLPQARSWTISPWSRWQINFGAIEYGAWR